MGNNDTKLTPTNILNRSYDQTYDVIGIIPMTENADGTAISRQKTIATEEKQDAIITALSGVEIPSGTAVNGTRDLTSANTWYAVPSAVPTVDYILDYSIENASGDIRVGRSNTGTPSTTNGMLALGTIMGIRMKANQSLYFSSSVAGDDINWGTKEI